MSLQKGRKFIGKLNLVAQFQIFLKFLLGVIKDAATRQLDIAARDELSYLAPLGSENIPAPYFKQFFFRGGGLLPPQTVKHHASQSEDRNNKYFILYIEFYINNKI
jgi:hypothetical protein